MIQARMGSSRMPGKSMALLAGRPLLWHILHRLKQTPGVDEIVVATTTGAEDDPLATFAEQHGARAVRGPAEDVLARYLLAARTSGADLIVRATGDAPLVCPRMLATLIEAIKRDGTEHAGAEQGVPCIHEGFSVLTMTALERLAREHGDNSIAREHVTGYFAADPAFVRTTRVPVPLEHRFTAKISVDTPADLVFLERLYERSGSAPGEIELADVVRALREDPALLDINRHVHRKGLDTTARRVLVRCDANSTLGFGHLIRCLAVAEELRDSFSCGVRFAMLQDAIAKRMAIEAGFPMDDVEPADENTWLEKQVETTRTHALLVDVRTALGPTTLERCRTQGTLVAVLDDASPRRLAADLAFYPPVERAFALDWQGSSTEVSIGWEWVPLRRSFAAASSAFNPDGPILISMGGSDPRGLTSRVLEALEQVPLLPLRIVLGPGFEAKPQLIEQIQRSPHKVEVLESIRDMRNAMQGVGLAILCFGVTAYEAAAAGLPAIHLCLDDDHVSSSKAFHGAGMALSLGRHDRLTDKALRGAVLALLGDPHQRARMGRAAREYIDGKGAQRIAARLFEGMQDGAV